MNEDVIRQIIEKLDEDEKDGLGGLLVALSVKAIREIEDSIKDGREREIFEVGKHIGVLEHLMEEYEKL